MTEAEVERTYSRRASKWKLTISILIIVLVVTVILALNAGYAGISFSDVLTTLAKRIPILNGYVDSTHLASSDESIILLLRLPRVLAGVLVGAALASSGVVYQGVFRNPMADSYILGVSAGASVGAVFAKLFLSGFTLFGFVGLTELCAFAGALGAVFLVYNMSRVGGRVPVTTLLLSGLAVTFFLLAVVAVMEVIAGEQLEEIVRWLMGGFSIVPWGNIYAVIPFVLLGNFIAFLFSRDLNLLALGEDTAQHLGVNTERVKQILLFLGAMTTAAAVSIAGLVGFVGLIIPHMTRLVIGPDHRILLPTSMIVGAIFLVICDSLARVITGTIQLPVGIITSLFGAPFFVFLLRKKKSSYAL